MRHVVTDEDTAISLGSGDVAVLATPRLIAWLEAATVLVAAPLLAEGQTSVGTAVRIDHVKATPVGRSVEVSARLVGPAGSRRLTFEVAATDDAGEAVAGGEITRVVVDRARFNQSPPA
ncbi:thioesterase family protein [Pedococcus bigeumensis]|uniref:Thioesterase n=1 Tax=Pedococcus bigeumensis TaxID=433644 RepID=A0A502CZT7_9MICO|nr:hotdog domain-containing protein [Pedococcus bigeumensis]TPG18142.1 thioesterase [Pedococcus bigeumensis]